LIARRKAMSRVTPADGVPTKNPLTKSAQGAFQ
jgi:hypothetical protein